ncbi:unnamed protein product [Discosporangium mesarthrocarpum]
MFGPAVQGMDGQLSLTEYQELLLDLLDADQDPLVVAASLDPLECEGDTGGNSVLQHHKHAHEVGIFGPGTGTCEIQVADYDTALFDFPNPSANFGPQFTPADDPAPADSGEFLEAEGSGMPPDSSSHRLGPGGLLMCPTIDAVELYPAAGVTGYQYVVPSAVL